MATLAISASKDTYAREVQPTTNFGSSTALLPRDGWSVEGYVQRVFAEFDLSSIPEGANIISATLKLYYYQYGSTDPSGKKLYVYKLTRPTWAELLATWNKYSAANWTNAGGDYVTSNPSGVYATVPASYGWMSWDVLAIVENAIANSLPLELLSRFETEGLTTGYSTAYFYSRDYATNPDLCPVLEITYTVAHTVTISDSLGMSDSITPAKGAHVTISEIMGMVDSAAPAKGAHVTISDSLGMRDRLDSRKHKTKIDDLPDDTITGGA